MKKLLVPSLITITSLSLAGCTLFPSPTAQPSQTTQITTENATANVTTTDNGVTITGNDDNSTFSFGGGLPSTWPSDLPTPADTTIAFAGTETDAETGVTTYSATFSLPISTDVQAALETLKTAFQRAGWTIGDESFGTFGITAGGFEATKRDQTANVAYVGATDTSNADESSSTITISAEYPS